MKPTTPSRDLIHPVLLCGGSGTRLWPLSRSLYPKQLLSLASDRSLLQETALRVAGPAFARPVVVCNEEQRFLVGQQLAEVGIVPAAILLEPIRRNTAPAIAVASLAIEREHAGALVMALPTDHVVALPEIFVAAAIAATSAARTNLVTFGIVPTRPETGYGYIQLGAPIQAAPSCYRIARFVEKPDAARASAFVASGDHLWNSGMFLFGAQCMLAELERQCPQLLEACRAALARGRTDLDFTRLDRDAFASAPAISIDRAVFEHATDAAVVPVDIGWNDLGSWSSLLEIGERDAQGNVMVGNIVALDVADSYLRSEGPVLAAIGLKDVIVVVTDDAVLVAAQTEAQRVGQLVEMLKRGGHSQHEAHTTVHRPWGRYKVLERGSNFQVKEVTVMPGAKLSLQLHRRRAEHWIVLSGRATVTRGDDVSELLPNQSTFIPIGTRHRLGNDADVPLQLIEVQSGDYLGEDDIERFDDAYGRDLHAAVTPRAS